VIRKRRRRRILS